MLVYRIVQNEERTRDLSGTGAFKFGGRWNNPGTFVLYASENRSLAMLETLVHVDESEMPPDMFIMEIEVSDKAPVYHFPDDKLPAEWMETENIALKEEGDALMKDLQYLAVKVRSAVLQQEFNYLLNPLYPDFNNLVKVVKVIPIIPDIRLF
ncbi:RES family NAD+ phosphorylase [Chitinophaga barathri]|uniref:RES domain-containing protein n=1 Tax=Chitinophaga barathri TaxID=1647451 RepID=A0A3N4M6U1_9BACT|nr:RES family NAD+ phosphorylase [Chitinophaga barathri]RPD39082.1 RES domain-containing protein [Chitinophaga barathri]